MTHSREPGICNVGSSIRKQSRKEKVWGGTRVLGRAGNKGLLNFTFHPKYLDLFGLLSEHGNESENIKCKKKVKNATQETQQLNPTAEPSPSADTNLSQRVFKELLGSVR